MAGLFFWRKKRTDEAAPAATEPTEVELAHIVRLAKVTKAQKEELSERLLDYKRRVLAGEKFEDLARQFSEDKSTSPKGGVLNKFGSGQLSSEAFEEVAFSLAKPKDISKPFQS